ncbi:MAG: Hpt domain-containing protein [Proteobacteria bacterium]|nr:Hpt domain-containing protein [Pseudomonadota bacterium]
MNPGDRAMVLDGQVIATLRADMDPEAFPDILEMFIIELSERLKGIALALDTSDHASLAREAHSLKGMSATIGARWLNDSALSLEMAAREADDNATVPSLHPAAEETLKEMTALRDSLD